MRLEVFTQMVCFGFNDGCNALVNRTIRDIFNKYGLKCTALLALSSKLHCMNNAKQKHLGCKKGEANQKQQLSDYKSIHSYTCD